MNKVELEEKFQGITERDVHSKALLNTDIEAYRRYKLKKHKVVSQKNDIESMKAQMTNINNEISEIKNLLTELLKTE